MAKTYSESDMGSMKGYDPNLGIGKSGMRNFQSTILKLPSKLPSKKLPKKVAPKKKPVKYLKKVASAANKVLGK